MRVLILTGSFPPMQCGVGAYTERLADALGQRGDLQIGILTDAAAIQHRHEPNYELLPIVNDWTMGSLPAMMKAVRAWRPDVVHVQYPTQGYSHKLLPWLLPTIFRFFKLRVVQTWHEYLPMGPYRRNFLFVLAATIVVVVRPDYVAAIPRALRPLTRRIQFRFIPSASTIPQSNLSDTDKRAIRVGFAPANKLLVAFFGFVYHHKGVDLLFDLLEPDKHCLVLVCELSADDAYHEMIRNRIRQGAWASKVSVTGFLPGDRVAAILAAADAVVFPFRSGGGVWNSSLHAASAQGTFVLTTSQLKHGYCEPENIYYARPGDVADMREGLASHIGRKSSSRNAAQCGWDSIAEAHAGIYKTMLDWFG